VLETERHLIPYTNTSISNYVHNKQQIILDFTNHPSTNNSSRAPNLTTKTQLRDLARLLRNVEPETFGLLKCMVLLKCLVSRVSTLDLFSRYTRAFIHLDRYESSFWRKELLFDQACPAISIACNGQLCLCIQLDLSIRVFGQGLSSVFDQDSAIDPKFPSTCSSLLVGFERFRHEEAQTDLLGDLE
jgi:hypothetical protein